MFFNSYGFLFGFLPAVLIVYFLLARFPRAGTWWMVAASFFFYARYRLDDLGLLVASILCNFLISHLIVRRTHRRAWLIFGIGVNLAALGLFKYSKFLPPDVILHNLAFPLGISFFTFSQIAYLVDVYKGVDHPAPMRDYALFVSFFPHLLSGPILRHKEMVPQFDSAMRRRPIPRHFARGFALIAIGLAKKILIADTLAPLVARTFDSSGALDPAAAWIGTTAYTFQLYNDFSGYCDIALGVSFLFNIRIPENFRAPYRSTSIQEFWQRWHITLSRFLRTYIFFPLARRLSGLAGQCLAAVITFILGGIWHGAGWTFLIWGALHGFALTTQVLWRRFGFRLPGIVGWALTFAFVNLSWVVFRAPNLQALSRVWGAMFSGIPKIPSPAILSGDPGYIALLAAIVLVAIPTWSFMIAKRMKPAWWTAGLTAMFLTMAVLRFSSVSYFLYYFF